MIEERQDHSSVEFLRLQLFLSRNGICSRRKAFDLVQEGYVAVNGIIIREPSHPICPDKDVVSVNGKQVKIQVFEYILLNKPTGVVTTKMDPFAEKTVLELLPGTLRHLHPVGRLDKDTEGLLLLTNDGGLTHQLTHPRFKIEKTYLVRIKEVLDSKRKEDLQGGVVIDGRKTAPVVVSEVKKQKGYCQFLITMHEGRNRQIRKMLQKVNCKVIYLKRLSQGPLVLGGMPSGQWRRLTDREVRELKEFSSSS